MGKTPKSILQQWLFGSQSLVHSEVCTQMGHAIARERATPLLDHLRDFAVLSSSAGGNSSFELNSQTLRLSEHGGACHFGLELELIQTQMTQKPMLRAEVYARALRASQNRKEDSV